jgi:hypothetical protein
MIHGPYNSSWTTYTLRDDTGSIHYFENIIEKLRMSASKTGILILSAAQRRTHLEEGMPQFAKIYCDVKIRT